MEFDCESLAQTLAANISRGIYVFDLNFHCKVWNPVMEKVTGMSKESCIGKKAGDLFLFLKNPGAGKGFRDVLEGKSIHTTLQGLRKGKAFPADISPVYNSKKEVIGGIVTLSASREREKKQADTEMLDKVASSVIITDLKGKITYWNRGATEMFGYTAEEIIGKTPAVLYPFQPAQEELEKDLAEIMAGNTIEREWKGKTKSGKEIWVKVNTSLMHNNKGEIAGFIGNSTEITALKKTEKALKESNNKLKTIIYQIPVVLFSIDHEGVFTLSEGRALRTLGMVPNQLVGQSAYELYEDVDFELVSGKKIKGKEAIQRVLEGESISGMTEEKGRRFETTMSPLREKEGKVKELIGISFDVTEKKKIENNLILKEKKLHALAMHLETAREEEKKKIAMDLHDELGQELIAQKLDLFWLKNKVEHRLKVRKTLKPKELIHKIDSLIALVNQSISSARRITHNLRPVILDQLGLIPAIENLAKTFSAHHKITCELDLDIGHQTIPVDLSLALFRLTQEMLTNIAKHAKASRVLINLKRNDDFIALQVIDDGVGLSPGQMNEQGNLGLFSMKERLLKWKGELLMKRGKTEGAIVEARVPVAEIK